MSEYSSLKATINANIKANNNQEITGSIMNSVLNAMVNSLGAGYQFIGVATPTNPGTAQTPDYKCFYLATTPGTYTNLGGLVVSDGEVALIKYDTSWTKEVTGAATVQQVFDMLVGTVKFIDGTQQAWNNFNHYIESILVVGAKSDNPATITYFWYNRNDLSAPNIGIQLSVTDTDNQVHLYNYNYEGLLNAETVYKMVCENPQKQVEVWFKTTSDPSSLTGSFMESTDWSVLSRGRNVYGEMPMAYILTKVQEMIVNSHRIVRITSKSQLSDIDNAENGVVYQLNFPGATTSANLPANLPFDIWGNNNIASLFTYKDGNYGCQYLISTMAIFYRIYAGQQYWDWVILTKPKEVTIGIGGDYHSLLYALKNTPSFVPIRILSDTTIDVEQEYKSIYGNDFWDNYAGYESEDKFMRGLWLDDGREVYGEENVVLYFPYSGNNGAVRNAFSILAMGKNTYVHDFSIKVNNNCEYHIHDDWFSGNKNYAEVRYERILFYGNSYSNICIGGGLGGSCKYIIKDCLFLTGTPTDYNVSYHGNGNLTDACCKIFVSGCYGQGQLVFRKMGPSLLATDCIVHGCKFSKIGVFNYDPENPPATDSMRLIAYNNTESGI